jgi:teichoic acid transport system permease protein
MNALTIVFKELIENKNIIFNLAKYELKIKYAGNSLGSVWLFLNPLIQTGLYWFVFGMGIRNNRPMDGGIPFLVWMLAGLIPWFYISACISMGANSIHGRLSMASKMNFPLSIIPVYIIFSQLVIHLIMVFLIFISMILFNVGFQGLSILEMLYTITASTIFVIGLSYITSTLSSIASDFRLLIPHITRFIFFLSPIMWSPTGPHWFRIAIRINPVFYLIQRYRNSFIYSNINSINPLYSLYFWVVMISILLLGTKLHVKFRRELIDYL